MWFQSVSLDASVPDNGLQRTQQRVVLVGLGIMVGLPNVVPRVPKTPPTEEMAFI